MNNIYYNDDKKNNFNSKLYSPLALAYIGDSVYEMLIREKLLLIGNMPPNLLHTNAVKMANASFQSKAVHFIMNILSDNEVNIVKRGRNSKSVSVPKNANIIDYKWATGLECLFGYLYLNEDTDRIKFIFSYIYDNVKR